LAAAAQGRLKSNCDRSQEYLFRCLAIISSATTAPDTHRQQTQLFIIQIFVKKSVNFATFTLELWHLNIRIDSNKQLEKILMNAEEKARQLIARERQHSEHLQDSMLNRSSHELETPSEGITEEKARELMAQERQHSEHLHDSMLSRSSQEVEASIAPDDTHK
jgi:signal transduction histidine kinase